MIGLLLGNQDTECASIFSMELLCYFFFSSIIERTDRESAWFTNMQTQGTSVHIFEGDNHPMQQPQKKEHPSTYMVQDRQNQQEMKRLTIQDRMITTAMGGLLPEQPDLTNIERVLDVGCGTGNWAMEVAQTHPTMSLTGVDISGIMLEYARTRAAELQLGERIEFRVMDALRMLEFPSGYFDLVNMRFGVSFLRTWDWPRIIGELARVTRPGGIIRITETDGTLHSNGPAHQQFFGMFQCAFFRAGHTFEETDMGVGSHLVPLLTQHGNGKVQSKAHMLEFRGGTPECQIYYEDVHHVVQTIRPFIQKWGCLSSDYEAICQQALDQIKQSDFHLNWKLLTAWCTKNEG